MSQIHPKAEVSNDTAIADRWRLPGSLAGTEHYHLWPKAVFCHSRSIRMGPVALILLPPSCMVEGE